MSCADVCVCVIQFVEATRQAKRQNSSACMCILTGNHSRGADFTFSGYLRFKQHAVIRTISRHTAWILFNEMTNMFALYILVFQISISFIYSNFDWNKFKSKKKPENRIPKIRIINNNNFVFVLSVTEFTFYYLLKSMNQFGIRWFKIVKTEMLIS